MATDKIFHIVIIHVTFITECLCASEMLLMCYFNAKARYRHEMARIDTSSIDFSICTHYIYAYAFIVDHSQAVFPSDPAKELGNNGAYRDFTTRDVNSAASSKRLLSFGGLNESANTALNAMIMSNQYIQRFSNNAIAFLRQHHFSGLDIDWQFPVTPQMQSGLVTLLRTLREAIDRDTTGEKLLLTVKCPAVPQGHPYDVPAISRYADYVILAAYNITPPNASLASFGSPLYGQEITVACRIKMGGQDFFDHNTRMHFTYLDINWLGYEDKRSVYEKIKWMKSLNIRGIMFSGVDEDDFSGTNCEDGRYPLLNFIKSNMTLPKQVLPKQTTTKRPPREQQSTYTAFRRLEASSSTGPTSTQTTLQSTDPTTVHEVTNQKVYKKSFHNLYLILLIIFLFCLVVLLIVGVYVFK